jgi:uncharacterized protein (TIGR02646 family)
VIRIDRGPEPLGLVKAREKRLPAAIDAFNAHGPGSKPLLDLLDGYDHVKKDLYLRQHKKCAYCERTPGFDGQPVEHFRPKKLAVRRSKSKLVKDRERYWWLTWTWENLLFACTTCNGPANKGNHFPLEAGSALLMCPVRPISSLLPPACFQTSVERPLLLDPAEGSIDPLDHLRWLPVDRTLARSLWTWTLRDLTTRGRVTKKRLGLHDLADDVNNRYRETIWPRFHNDIERKLGVKKPAYLLATWDKLVRDLVKPTSPLTAASWSILDVLRSCTPDLRRVPLPAPPRP